MMLADTKQIKEFSGLLICRIRNSELCFDMRDLVKIVDPPETDNLNEENNSLEYGGFLFQLIKIHEFYELNLTSSNSSKLILLEVMGKTVCFIVDQVIEMIAAGERNLDSFNYLYNESPYLKGTIEYEGRKILVPDLKNIIDLS